MRIFGFIVTLPLLLFVFLGGAAGDELAVAQHPELEIVEPVEPASEKPHHLYLKDVYIKTAQTQGMPMLEGPRRFLIGTLIMVAALLYFSKVTYPKLMTFQHQVRQKVVEIAKQTAGMDADNKVEYAFKRYVEFAKEHPYIVAGEVTAATVGLILALSGLFQLLRPRKILKVMPRRVRP